MPVNEIPVELSICKKINKWQPSARIVIIFNIPPFIIHLQTMKKDYIIKYVERTQKQQLNKKWPKQFTCFIEF